jgi:predicted RNA-binding Zn-ribbon protein involved in translation (DUF1610 family)
MKLGHTCTVCGERVGDADLVHCEDCGADMHGDCIEYETKYECEECGDELWLGALEF